MKRTREEAEVDTETTIAKLQKIQNDETPLVNLSLPDEVILEDVVRYAGPAEIVRAGMTSKAMQCLAGKAMVKYFSDDLAAVAQAIAENPAPSPIRRGLRRALDQLYPVSASFVTKALLLAYSRKLSQLFTGKQRTEEAKGCTGDYKDTFVHIEGYPQVTRAAIMMKLFPKIRITPSFLREISLDDISLFSFEIVVHVDEIIQAGLMDELLKLTTVSRFKLDPINLQMLAQKSLQSILHTMARNIQTGSPIYFGTGKISSLFFELLTEENFCENIRLLIKHPRTQIARRHIYDIVRSKLSTQTVIDLLLPEHQPIHLLHLLLQAGRDKQSILESSLFSQNERNIFSKLASGGFSIPELRAPDSATLGTVFQMAVLSDVGEGSLKNIMRYGNFVSSIYRILLAFHAKVPTEILVMMGKGMLKTQSDAYMIPNFLFGELPYEVVHALAPRSSFYELRRIIKPSQLGEFMARLFEDGRIPISFCNEALTYFFEMNDYTNPEAVKDLLMIKGGRPYYHYNLFKISNMSSDIASFFLGSLPDDELFGLMDNLDHLNNSADDKIDEKRTLKPYLLGMMASRLGGIQKLRGAGYDRLFDGMFQDQEFYHAQPSHNLPLGSTLHQVPAENLIRIFGRHVGFNDFRRFIMLDHIVQNFELFDEIDLAFGLPEKNIGVFNWTINTYVKLMTPEERADFLGKRKTLSGCKLTAAIRQFEVDNPSTKLDKEQNT